MTRRYEAFWRQLTTAEKYSRHLIFYTPTQEKTATNMNKVH